MEPHLVQEALVSETEKRTYTIVEAARLLGIGRTVCYEAARQGQIPTIKVGRRLLVPKVALDRMLRGEAA